MKLKVFNTTNVKVLNKKEPVPFLQVNNKVGLFNLNKTLSELLELKHNDQVQFMQDEEEPERWFIEKVKADGFVVREKENMGKGVLFNSMGLARLIFQSVKCEYKSGRILLGEKVTSLKNRTVYELVTASLNAYKGEK